MIKIAVYLFVFYLSGNILRMAFISGPYQLTNKERSFAPIILCWLTDLAIYGGNPLIYLMVSSQVKESVPIYRNIREFCIRYHCPFCKKSTAVAVITSEKSAESAPVAGPQLNAVPSPSHSQMSRCNTIHANDLELEIIA